MPLLLVAALGLTGCTREVDAPPAAPATVHPVWPGCDPLGAFADAGIPPNPFETGSVPAGFAPRAAVLCTVQDRAVVDGAEDVLVADVERRATEITPLLTYLARPSRRSTGPGPACPAMGWAQPWLFLVDADGRWISPQLPTDACGFPLDLFGRPDHQLPYDDLPYTDRVIRTHPR